jgi:hypothetical protein
MPAFRAPPSRAFSQLGETGAIGIDPTAIFRVDSDNEANATIRIGPFVLLRYCQMVQRLSLHRSRLFAPTFV